MNQIARCDWLPERARWSIRTTRCIPREKFPRKPYNKSFIAQVWSVKMAGYWPRSFFCEFMDLYFVSVHKHAKKKLGQYPAILTSHLVNNPYLLFDLQDPRCKLLDFSGCSLWWFYNGSDVSKSSRSPFSLDTAKFLYISRSLGSCYDIMVSVWSILRF